MTNATISRRADVVSRVEGDETLVLDLRTQTAHCLSGDLARVWGATETSVAGLAAALSLSAEAVEAAAASLAELGLVQVGASGMSRRMLVRGAAVGGAVVAAGAISIPLPAAAAANSATFTTSAFTCSATYPYPISFNLNVSGTQLLVPNKTYRVSLSYSNGASTVTDANVVSFTTNGSGQIGNGSGVAVQTAGAFGGGPITITVTRADAATDTQTFATTSHATCGPVVTLNRTAFTSTTNTFKVNSTSPVFASSHSVTVTVTGTGGPWTITPTSTTTNNGGVLSGSTTYTLTFPSGAQTGVVTFSDGTVTANVQVSSS